jgi:peptidoglycan/xylan/chitin deacetylase (PgdA/CDA1 family)
MKITRRLRNWLAPGGLILLYHRVAEVPTDPFKLCVTPEHFAEHLAVLSGEYQPMSLRKMRQTLESGQSPNRAIAVTFDDGYADNLWNAKPLLEAQDVPATVFVATGQLEEPREFWWDELDRLLLQPGRLPSCLDLTIEHKLHHWDLGQAADYSMADHQRDRHWNWYVQEQTDPGPRQSLYRALYQLLYPLSLDQRQLILDQLLTWAGLTVKGRPNYAALSATEVSRLGDGGLVEVGAHTINHPFLSTLSAEAQWQEIQQSKAALETLIDQPVHGFAYPHGNYSPETMELVEKAGFTHACATIEGRVGRKAHRFQMPRVVVEDCDGEAFAQFLTNWFQR